MSTKFGYNMTSNKLVMTKVHVFFEWPSYILYVAGINGKFVLNDSK
jgi:hypothetical protein